MWTILPFIFLLLSWVSRSYRTARSRAQVTKRGAVVAPALAAALQPPDVRLRLALADEMQDGALEVAVTDRTRRSRHGRPPGPRRATRRAVHDPEVRLEPELSVGVHPAVGCEAVAIRALD